MIHSWIMGGRWWYKLEGSLPLDADAKQALIDLDSDSLHLVADFIRMTRPEKGRSEKTGNIVHHGEEVCVGEHCPFHNPSGHAMVDWPMHLRETGLIERTCEHGVGHPDPDSAAFYNRAYGHGPGTWDTHGCDGCCHE